MIIKLLNSVLDSEEAKLPIVNENIKSFGANKKIILKKSSE